MVVGIGGVSWGILTAIIIYNWIGIVKNFEDNFRYNAMVQGVTLKSMMLKFSSISYLTLFMTFWRAWRSVISERKLEVSYCAT